MASTFFTQPPALFQPPILLWPPLFIRLFQPQTPFPPTIFSASNFFGHHFFCWPLNFFQPPTFASPPTFFNLQSFLTSNFFLPPTVLGRLFFPAPPTGGQRDAAAPRAVPGEPAQAHGWGKEKSEGGEWRGRGRRDGAVRSWGTAELSCPEQPHLGLPWGSPHLPAVPFKLSLEPSAPSSPRCGHACLWPCLWDGPQLCHRGNLSLGWAVDTHRGLSPAPAFSLAPGGLWSCGAAVPLALHPFAPAWMDAGPGSVLVLAGAADGMSCVASTWLCLPWGGCTPWVRVLPAGGCVWPGGNGELLLCMMHAAEINPPLPGCRAGPAWGLS